MISTKFASAAALFALLSSALALPQSIERRKNDLPLWCDPGSPYDSNNAWYDDESGSKSLILLPLSRVLGRQDPIG
jgi:hypothetical protein